MSFSRKLTHSNGIPVLRGPGPGNDGSVDAVERADVSKDWSQPAHDTVSEYGTKEPPLVVDLGLGRTVQQGDTKFNLEQVQGCELAQPRLGAGVPAGLFGPGRGSGAQVPGGGGCPRDLKNAVSNR